eukprot:SAG22_NODE_1996_length_3186_cov_23.257856_5_plen_99_part_00
MITAFKSMTVASPGHRLVVLGHLETDRGVVDVLLQQRVELSHQPCDSGTARKCSVLDRKTVEAQQKDSALLLTVVALVDRQVGPLCRQTDGQRGKALS